MRSVSSAAVADVSQTSYLLCLRDVTAIVTKPVPSMENVEAYVSISTY